MLKIRHKRAVALKACELLRADRWWRWVDRWQGLVSLNYHRFGDRTKTPCDPAVFSATAEQFDSQLRYLKQNCDLVSVTDLPDIIRPGNSRRAVLLTIDDGYLDNYEVAFPILKSHGVPAVIFLATGFIDQPKVAWWDEINWIVRRMVGREVRMPDHWHLEPLPVTDETLIKVLERLLRVAKTLPPPELESLIADLASSSGIGRAPITTETAPWMTWDMIREMYQAGIQFGGHTVTHPVLSYCSADQQRREIFTSKARIEQELGTTITAFSYPIGAKTAFSQQTQQLVQQAGYRWAFSFYSGYSRFPTNTFDLRRVPANFEMSAAEFRLTVSIPRLFAR